MKKKTFKTLLKMIAMPLLFMLLFPLSGSAEGMQRGDADFNQIINIRDVTALIDTLMVGNGGTVYCDVNGDLKVDICDVTALIDYLLTGERTWWRHDPPVPDNARVFTVNGVSFAMLPVEGDWYNANRGIYPRAQLLHDFYIGQTEVTRELWKAVMGEEAPPGVIYTPSPTMPVTNTYWQDCQVFMEKLNELTGIEFRIPTYDQWQYAAIGGRLTQGYTYAGSDDVDEVAWNKENWPEIFMIDYLIYSRIALPVGLKKPNELGLYDMSGNVCEWVNSFGNDGEVIFDTNKKYMLGGDTHYDVGYCEPLYYDQLWAATDKQAFYYGPVSWNGKGGGFRLAVMASDLGE